MTVKGTLRHEIEAQKGDWNCGARKGWIESTHSLAAAGHFSVVLHRSLRRLPADSLELHFAYCTADSLRYAPRPRPPVRVILPGKWA